MSGISVLANGSSCVETVNGFQSNGCGPKSRHAPQINRQSSEEEMVKFRRLFDQVLACFLKEAAGKGLARPLPPVVGGDGKTIDLFELLLVVRENGGFNSVSKNGQWALVAKELALDLKFSASVKLIYGKYLRDLEIWSNGSSENSCCRSYGSREFISSQLLKEFRSLANGPGIKRLSNGTTQVRYKIHDHCIEKDTSEKGPYSSDSAETCNILNGLDKRLSDDDEISDNVILDKQDAKQEISSPKRKRESLLGMLNWVVQIAKCPDDSSIGEIPAQAKRGKHEGGEFWIQAIRAREVLFQTRQVPSVLKQSVLQNGQRISSMHDVDAHNGKITVKSRCSGRVLTAVKSCSCACCNSHSAIPNRLTSPPKIEVEQICEDKSPFIGESSSSRKKGKQSRDRFPRRQPCVGRLFQAEVPDWTGMISHSDPKWLGTCYCPLDFGKKEPSSQIGRGRPASCGCRVPGSVECVRFHIAERRMKWKLELGAVFYHWRFNQMGEEVSLQWTVEEEKRFKNMIRLNPESLSKRFWAESLKCFPEKKKQDLVSYYFNVFLINRRSYQNRVTPWEIDSDDDEEEFGCVSGSFGHEAVKVPGSNVSICSQNMQCIEL